MVNLTEGATLLSAHAISNADRLIAVVTNSGYLLIFPSDELPTLSKGKGNKLITLKAGEHVVAVSSLCEDDALIIHTAKRTLTLKPTDWISYQGKRAARGATLPKGFMTVINLQKSTPTS